MSTATPTPAARPDHAAVCSCGETGHHAIAKRNTADGIAVILRSDGSVSGRFGALPGVACVRPRTADATRVALAAGWMLLGEVSMYDLAELGEVYASCRWAAGKGLGVEEARAHLTRTSGTKIRFVWTVQETDRDGRPTLRTCKLNRLQWPGLAVWHERGVYTLVREIQRSGSYQDTGFHFSSQRDLAEHLLSVAAMEVPS